jgi:hypothetical protein
MLLLPGLVVISSWASFCLGDPGNFSRTCSNIVTGEAPFILSAKCTRTNGTQAETTLNLNECYAVSNEPYNRTVYPAKG